MNQARQVANVKMWTSNHQMLVYDVDNTVLVMDKTNRECATFQLLQSS